MSSSDRLNPQQLQMFMPAGELIQGTPNDLYAGANTESGLWASKDELWEVKLEESKLTRRPPHQNRLYASIKSGGVKQPVRIRTGSTGYVGDGKELTIVDGHHRVAAANDIDPQMEVPIDQHIQESTIGY